MHSRKGVRALQKVQRATSAPWASQIRRPLSAEPSFSIQNSALEGRAAYLDAQATTPMDYRVLDAMLPFYTTEFGNAHSRTHEYGWKAEEAVENARSEIASLIGAKSSKEIIFTSGATESNNIAVKGAAQFYGKKKKHVITLQTEHKCVLDSCRHLESEGFNVTYLGVQKGTGLVDLSELESAIRPGETSLISVMGVNNEIGTVQPLKEIGALCKKHKVKFHTDCAQMVGKLPIDVDEMNIDLLSISGHKIYGPGGVGALYARRKPRVRLVPQMSGGGQERGLRSGTLPVALAVGLGKACSIAAVEMENDTKWISKLQKKLIDGITSKHDHIVFNGDPERGYVGCTNLSFSFVEGESLLMAIKNLAVSSGSACTSASLEPSYVLRALGVGEDLAHTSIRFGIHRFTTEEEIDFALETVNKHVDRLREMSPLYELVKEGVDLSTISWTQDH